MTQPCANLNPEAKTTVKHILEHILDPVSQEDRREIIEHLCSKYDIDMYPAWAWDHD